MSFPHYSDYRESGVTWLGSIPRQWRLKPLWGMYRRTKRDGYPNEELLSVYRDYGVIPKASRDDNFNKPSDDLATYQLVNSGDLTINKMKAWQGSVGISEHRGIVSPAYFVYERQHDECSRYLHYLMRCDRYIAGYFSLSKGIRVNQWDLDPVYHSRLPVLLPTYDEQVAIAVFLDFETAKVDSLVAEQERLIALLKEKRLALISHAVTKGLDPNAPMKDSGIEWLGDVPTHWNLSRLKHVANLIIDCPHETPVYDADGDFLVIRTADVEEGDLDPSKMYRLSEEQFVARTRRQSLIKHDLVYGREGERWGHAALVPESDRYCLGQRMMQFRLEDSQDAMYMMWQLNAISTYRQGEVDTVGATSPHVNVSTIRNYWLTEPPFNEQRTIAAFIAKQTANIGELANEAKHAIDLLKERRSALISAAVTGKIDVRDHRN